MTFDVKLSITGIQEAQERNARAMAALRPTGAFGRAIQYVTVEAQRYAVGYTHVDTGSLKAAQRMEIGGLRGRVYIDPSATNPRSGQRPAEYGRYEHGRGGSHAFYQRVISDQGARLRKEGVEILRGAI
jgi:hypothetical protein